MNMLIVDMDQTHQEVQYTKKTKDNLPPMATIAEYTNWPNIHQSRRVFPYTVHFRHWYIFVLYDYKINTSLEKLIKNKAGAEACQYFGNLSDILTKYIFEPELHLLYNEVLAALKYEITDQEIIYQSALQLNNWTENPDLLI